jgi:pyrroline-5-carboxylate reductase
MTLAHQRIAFIGAGNMASAIIRGLLERGVSADTIHATGRQGDRLAALSSALGIRTGTDNVAAATQADIVVLAVKPQQLKPVSEVLRPALAHRPLVISIAAGVNLALIERWLGGELPMVRAMPNTPAQCLSGATGLFANACCSERHRSLTQELFGVVGICEWLDSEHALHAITALSGSGPAYAFHVIEAMEAAAVSLGLTPDLARRFAAQTVKGAAEMVLGSTLDPGQLKRNVMSPGGTTERAIQVLEQQGLMAMFEQAMRAASDRSHELAEILAHSQ